MGKIERISNNILVAEELGCAYRLNRELNVLEWCPMTSEGILFGDEWGLVEEDLVGEEEVTYSGMEVTFSQVYRDVENKLKIRGNNE